MKEHFEIIGGVVYLDKSLFVDALKVDNDLSKLIGSTCVNIFKAKPKIQSGVESVTIDYAMSDSIRIDQDPEAYVHNLQDHYHSLVRGHIVVDTGEGHPVDLVINSF